MFPDFTLYLQAFNRVFSIMNWQFWKKSEKKESKPKSKVREWWDAILFAVIAATLIRWLIMEAYTIPTPSMENSLMVGDFLFVSKFHYGTRTTTTPLQVPLTHQKIWFTNIPSYVEWIKLPQYRLPGFSEVKRNDVVVFNVPGIEENNLYEGDRSKWIDYPIDLKTNYIKRCVAIPGDTLKIIDHQVYINSEKGFNPPDMLYTYSIIAKDIISERILDKFDIDNRVVSKVGNLYEYHAAIAEAQAEELRKLPFISEVKVITRQGAESNIYPDASRFPWNADSFGPIVIPKEGMTITIDSTTLTLYGKMIERYDYNKDVKIEGDKLTIEGKEVTEYTFKQNYYFMMGDNRHNSLDSRYWGFVPEDHIVGKAFFIWLSLEREDGFGIRWRRFFKLIE